MSYQLYRAQINDDTPSNGGFPINEVVSTVSFLPVIFAAQDALQLEFIRKFTMLHDASALYSYAYLFDLIDATLGDHYFNIILEPQPGNRETAADLTADLGNRLRYGVGRLTAPAAIGAQTVVVDVKDSALAIGTEKIFYANNTTLTDNLKFDARATASLGDTSNQEEVICDNVISTSGSEVTIHLATPLTKAYVAGDKVQTYPDKIDITPSYSNVDKSSIVLATFDETALLLFYSYTWEDVITLTMQDAAGNYTASSARFDTYAGVGNKDTDFSLTNPGFASAAVTIPAGTWAGTIAGGESIVFWTHGAMQSVWVRYFHPPLAGVKRGTLPFAGRYELESV